MTPEEKQLLIETSEKLDKLIDLYYRINFIDKHIFDNPVTINNGLNVKNNVYLPTNTAFFGSTTLVNKQSAISPPSGGATVDSQARTAISTIITTLQNLGLTN